jgi:hypothetical protein
LSGVPSFVCPHNGFPAKVVRQADVPGASAEAA